MFFSPADKICQYLTVGVCLTLCMCVCKERERQQVKIETPGPLTGQAVFVRQSRRDGCETAQPAG